MAKIRYGTATRLLVLLFMMGGFFGCASLPDLNQFVASTTDLSSAVIAGGTAVESELVSMEGGEQSAQEFGKAWTVRKNAMIGLVRYADALNAIVQAGRTGANSMGKLADSLTGLATAAGVVLPASGVVSVATDAAKMIYQEIANVRAARSLKNAMGDAQGAIDRISQGPHPEKRCGH